MLFAIIYWGIAVLVIGLLGSLSLIKVGYESHIDMMQGEHIPLAKGTFQDFLNQFKKYTWERQLNFPKSFFSKERLENYSHAGEIHASRIIFDGVGMVMKNYKEWGLFSKWLEKNKLVEDKEVLPDSYWSSKE
jgi:hypothetical protein